MKCSRTRKSVPRTISTATRVSIRTWAVPAHKVLAVLPMHSAIFSATSSARRPVAPHAAVAAARARRCIAAPICATAWKSRWNRPRTATTRKFACRAGCRARSATVRAPSPAPSRKPARPVAVRVRCGCRRASSAFSKPARSATAPAPTFPTRAAIATAPAR